ncbi:hypothetical protein J6590_016558 [Homalodisca vitripennis]|nr:hypothetical protein J6590_016558 [Homalodisca vitripennis]
MMTSSQNSTITQYHIRRRSIDRVPVHLSLQYCKFSCLDCSNLPALILTNQVVTSWRKRRRSQGDTHTCPAHNAAKCGVQFGGSGQPRTAYSPKDVSQCAQSPTTMSYRNGVSRSFPFFQWGNVGPWGRPVMPS